jgi:hypothetical protein
MRATLEFTLPKETVEHQWAVNAPKMAGCISETDEKLRSWLKHGHTFKSADDALEAVREMFDEVLCLAAGEV